MGSVMNPDGTVNLEGLSRVTEVKIEAPSDTASLKDVNAMIVGKDFSATNQDMVTIGYVSTGSDGYFAAVFAPEMKTEYFISNGEVVGSVVDAINSRLSSGEYYYVGLSAGPGGASNEEMLNTLDKFIKVKTV